jgi:Uma2 family endonuclease
MTTVIDATSGMTFEEFLRLDGHYEYVNGKAIEMSPISEEHSDISCFVGALLRLFTEQGGGGRVLGHPYVMRPVAGETGRAPDVMFVSSEHLDRIKPTHLEGPADLVVEVVSPESRVRDRGDKFYEYEQAGVREYWIIDSDHKRAEFYRLGSDGAYEPAPRAADGRYESAITRGSGSASDGSGTARPSSRSCANGGSLPE